MIDDFKDNIKAVQNECVKQGIKFKRYLYPGTKRFEEKTDKKVASYQLKHLLAHNQ